MGLIQNYIDRRVANFFDNFESRMEVTGKLYNDELYELQENRIWYKANKDILLRFYKTTRRVNQLYPIQDFYRLAPGTVPIQHYPLADMISKTMVNLVFSEKPEITFETGNQSRDSKLNKIIDKIYEENKIEDLLQNAGELESYSGAVAFKPIIDPEFSEYPIIMAYPKEDIEVIRKYDRVSAVIFKDYYNGPRQKYVLYTECGMGYIDYKLYEIGSDKRERKEVSLKTLPETSGLKPLKFYKKDGSKLNQLMCVYKENKTNATSDYSGIIDDFQALDEIYTNMINYIRKSKVKVYMPENMCKKNKKGETVVPFDYDTDYTILYDSNPEGTKQEAKRDVIDIQSTVNGYIISFNEVLKHAVLNTGLSLSSIGYDISGANASGEALAIREKVSMRTRSEKIHRWDAALKSLTRLLLALSTYTISDESTVYIEDLFDYNVLVSFAEYESPTFDAVVSSLRDAKEAGLIDLDTALHRLWDGEYSEDEIAVMKYNIENALPDVLTDDKLVDTEETEEPEEEEKEND